MARQLSTAEQQKRRKARQARRLAREEREREAARWVLPAWMNALVLIGASAIGALIGWVTVPLLMPATDLIGARVYGVTLGAVSALLIAAGVLGGIQMKPRWWFALAAFPVGTTMFFAVLDAMGAIPLVRPLWMLSAVLLAIGWLGPMVFAGVSGAPRGRTLRTLVIGAVAAAGGALLLVLSLSADGPIHIGLVQVGGRPVDYSPADGIAPVALAVGGLILLTLGLIAVVASIRSLLRARRAV